MCVVCVFDSAASSEEELSSSHKPRALTHKAHSEILRSEVRHQNGLKAVGVNIIYIIIIISPAIQLDADGGGFLFFIH